MFSRVFKPRVLSCFVNRFAILHNLLRQTPRHSLPFCRVKLFNNSQNLIKLANFPKQSIIRHYCNAETDPFEIMDNEASDEGDGTIYLDIEEDQSMRIEVPDVWQYLPLIVVDFKPLFPRFSKVIVLSHPKLMELIRQKVKRKEPYVGIFLRKDEESDDEVVDNLNKIYDIGTFAYIQSLQDYGDHMRIVVQAQRRIKIIGQPVIENELEERNLKISRRLRSDQYPRRSGRLQAKNTTEVKVNPTEILIVEVENLKNERTKLTKEITALKWEVMSAIKQMSIVSNAHKNLIETATKYTDLVKRSAYLSDFGASISGAEPVKLQRVMSEISVPRRMYFVLKLLREQLNVHTLQAQFALKAEEKVINYHRKAILEAKLKAVREELGIESEDGILLAEKFKRRLNSKCVPLEVANVIDEELNKLRCLDCHSETFILTRNYLDWLTVLPWGLSSIENLNMEIATKVLEEDHYGMEEIKRRILEFMASSQLQGDTQGQILCFHGPPGVGKTSIARSIARALNRKFFNFSVGGLSDVAEIKGHRRTYIGAMPGKIIQCLKSTKTENPLILIDEVDKLSTRRTGRDTVSAMLELLDPEQNKSFIDFFMDVPIDLSRVLFICTANEPDMIPQQLRDRMELLPVTGFIDAEKWNIATKYLVPKILRECGVEEKKFFITKDALNALILNYCRESGVRKLQQKIDKIIRNFAMKLVQHQAAECIVSIDNLESLIGKPPYRSDRFYKQTPPGVVMSLMCSPLRGGGVVYVEITKRRPSDEIVESNKSKSTKYDNLGIHLTGNLGAVMEESAEIALTVARNFVATNFKGNDFLETQKLHLHVPSGALPKDGSNVGVTIVTALVSLATNCAVRQNMAIMGEISLTGKVLPATALKEKIIAAKRNGISSLILPKANQQDFEDLPIFIREGIETFFVDCFDDVYKVAFGNCDLIKFKEVEKENLEQNFR